MDALVHEQAPAAILRSTRRRHRLLRAFLRNPSLLIGMLILLSVIAIAATAGWLFTDDPMDMAGTRDKIGFLEAQIAFALKRPDLADAVHAFLKNYV
jgi:hypothetical protein